MNRADIALASQGSRLPGEGQGPRSSDFRDPPPGGKQMEHLPIEKSGKLLAWRGLNHSLSAEAGFQIYLHMIGPILLDWEMHSSFYRLSNQHLQPIKFNSKWADDQASSVVPPSAPALPFLPPDLFISFRLPSHKPSSQILIFSLVNMVLI